MTSVTHDESAYVPPAEVEEPELYHPKTFIGKYIWSQDADGIAVQYGITAIGIGLVALVLSGIMRLQLGFPHVFSFITPNNYLQFVTMHGMSMVIYLLTALFLGGFGNYLIPLMVGARDMVFPYVNMVSYWVYLFAVLLLVASFFVTGGPTGAGWTLYPPQAISQGTPGASWGIILMLVSLAFFIVGFTMGGLNYVVTVLQARTRGMTMMRLPLTVWGIFMATVLALLAFPALFVSGMNPYFGFFFATTTLIIAVPTAIEVYNWVLTLWRGNIHLTVPMLFAIGFIFTFINGGLTGLFLGNATVSVPLSDTMFVVAHFHMVMAIAPIMVVFGAIYHWYPKITGRMLNDTQGKFHFWVTFVGSYCIYYPMHYLGMMGVPRRYYAIGGTDFIPPSAHFVNEWITIAALIVGMVQLVFLYNLISSYFKGKPSGSNPWNATTLEWQTPDTPPKHGNFAPTLPVVYRWAYDYSVPGAAEDFIPQNQPPSRRTGGLEGTLDAAELGAQKPGASGTPKP